MATAKESTMRVAGGTFGVLVALVLLRTIRGLGFLRDVALASGGAFLASRWAWRKLRGKGIVAPASSWHGGQLALASVAGLVVAFFAFVVFSSTMTMYADHVYRVSGLPRLSALLSVYVAVAIPVTLFIVAWMWFDVRRSR